MPLGEMRLGGYAADVLYELGSIFPICRLADSRRLLKILSRVFARRRSTPRAQSHAASPFRGECRRHRFASMASI